MRNKLENVNWHDILGDEQWLQYIKSLEDEFIPHRLITKFRKHKGKFPMDSASLRKI